VTIITDFLTSDRSQLIPCLFL